MMYKDRFWHKVKDVVAKLSFNNNQQASTIDNIRSRKRGRQTGSYVIGRRMGGPPRKSRERRGIPFNLGA